MKRSHKQQHLAKRQSLEAEFKAQLQDYRSQNQKLRRENARLRRENDKLRADASFEEEPEPLLEVKRPSLPVCEACASSDIKKFATPGRILTICRQCHHRKADLVVITD
jgi:regulator of replication initiation timing